MLVIHLWCSCYERRIFSDLVNLAKHNCKLLLNMLMMDEMTFQKELPYESVMIIFYQLFPLALHFNFICLLLKICKLDFSQVLLIRPIFHRRQSTPMSGRMMPPNFHVPQGHDLHTPLIGKWDTFGQMPLLEKCSHRWWANTCAFSFATNRLYSNNL